MVMIDVGYLYGAPLDSYTQAHVARQSLRHTDIRLIVPSCGSVN